MLTFGGLYAISFHSQADIPIVTFRRQAVNDEVHDTTHRLYLRLDGGSLASGGDRRGTGGKIHVLKDAG